MPDGDIPSEAHLLVSQRAGGEEREDYVLLGLITRIDTQHDKGFRKRLGGNDRAARQRDFPRTEFSDDGKEGEKGDEGRNLEVAFVEVQSRQTAGEVYGDVWLGKSFHVDYAEGEGSHIPERLETRDEVFDSL